MTHPRPAFLVAALAIAGCHSCSIVPPRPRIVCDGELDEPSWAKAIRTGSFLDDSGAPSAPYSDARFLVQTDALYIALYAADEDIRSDDTFTVQIGDRTFAYHPSDRGPDVGVDMDGTLNDATNDDEEWLVEARISYEGLPHGLTPLTIRRCDTMKTGGIRCGVAHLRLGLP